jgi:hypothetical protein
VITTFDIAGAIVVVVAPIVTTNMGVVAVVTTTITAVIDIFSDAADTNASRASPIIIFATFTLVGSAAVKITASAASASTVVAIVAAGVSLIITILVFFR